MITLYLTIQLALSNFGCGFEPFKPFGCEKAEAVCFCDDSGECKWIFIGCK